MTDADITALSHDRDSDGDLLPVEESVEIHGDSYDVDIYPATTGQRNEWLRRLDSAGEDLGEELTADLLDEFCADLTPGDFGCETWADVRPAVTDALANTIMARLFDAGDSDEFIQALQARGAGGGEGN